MISAIIVEDNPRDAFYLHDILKTVQPQIMALSICHNVADAYKIIVDKKPDLVFLDIDLGVGGNGYDLLTKFSKLDFGVIFTTQYFSTENAVRAFKACAIDFLEKPIQNNKLAEALDSFEQNRSTNAEQLKTLIHNNNVNTIESIWIKNLNMKTQIYLQNIMYASSADYATIFELTNPVQGKTQYISSDSIGDWEDILAGTDIIRVHRQKLVNVKFVDRFIHDDKSGYVLLKNKMQLRVSSERKKEVLKKLNL